MSSEKERKFARDLFRMLSGALTPVHVALVDQSLFHENRPLCHAAAIAIAEWVKAHDPDSEKGVLTIKIKRGWGTAASLDRDFERLVALLV